MSKPFQLGLDADSKARLLGRLRERAPTVDSTLGTGRPPPRREALGHPKTLREIELIRTAGEAMAFENPFFRVHEGKGGAWTESGGRRLSNFGSYDYLGLNSHPEVATAAKEAIDLYGTSVSASRIASGERPPHRTLERALAGLYEAQDCVAMVSGHAANVTTIAHLVTAGDAVVYDAAAHNSILQGALLSGARRVAFAHNDLDDLARQLKTLRGEARRRLVVIEGHYSMDGDMPDLPRLIDIVRANGAHLMVDEAHSLGVLGATGRGVFEHFGVDPRSVDLWMGTLSKTLAGCGGYIAGSARLIENIRHTAPGFLYSVGMPPPVAAASTAALAVMRREPDRVARLQRNGRLFLSAVKAEGLNTGASIGAAIVPVMTGGSLKAAMVAQALWEAGVNVQAVVYPAVPQRAARLRFFISSEHEPSELERVAVLAAQLIRSVRVDKAMIASAARLAIGAGRPAEMTAAPS